MCATILFLERRHTGFILIAAAALVAGGRGGDGRWRLYPNLEDGSDVVQLTDDPFDDRMPGWRP